MSFIRFSDEYVLNGTTLVENVFINDYMPHADSVCNNVYLYGLMQKNNPLISPESFMQTLKISFEELTRAFSYWDEQGILQVVSLDPLEIIYSPIKSITSKTRRIKPEKYADFSKQVQRILSERMIDTNEFNEYFNTIETYGFQPEALVTLIKYCTNQKGVNVSYKYILKVAADWAKQGFTNVDNVTREADRRMQQSKNVGKILDALKVKRLAENDDHILYDKWTKNFGFDINSIMFAISLLKDKKGGMQKLDSILHEYFKHKAFSEQEMQNFSANKAKLKELAINVNKALGIYYESLDAPISAYIQPWQAMGFDEESIVFIANYCLRRNIRTLSGMDEIMKKLYKQGVISIDAIRQHFVSIHNRDNIIKEILEKSGLSCSVNSHHRENYTTWSEVWNFSDDVIKYACSLACGKVNPISYINSTLANWKNSNITTVEKASKAMPLSQSQPQTKNKYNSHNRSYTDEELESLIDDIDSIEI